MVGRTFPAPPRWRRSARVRSGSSPTDAARLGRLPEGSRGARGRGPTDGELGAARALVLDVIENHDQLKLGLPGGRRRHDHLPGPRRPTTATDFTPEQLDLQARARRFVDEILIPNEELAERSGGHIPDELHERIKTEAIEQGLSAASTPRSTAAGLDEDRVVPRGGTARALDQRALHMPGAYNVLANGTPEQIDRYLRPALRGELHDAYAVTEADAGSDPSRIRTTARKTESGWVIDGEKWFVTYGDIAKVYIVMAKALVDGGEHPTLFLVDAGLDGIEVVDDPPFTHLPARPPGDPVHRRRGGRRRRDRRRRRRGRPPARLVHRRADRHRRPRRGLHVAAARGGDRLGDRARAGRQPPDRLPGRVLPAGRLGGRRRRRPAADARGRAARRRGRRPEGRPRQGLDGEAVGERGRLPLRRPRGPGVRGPRIHAHERRGALQPRAARRPHLGGHERDPAAHRGPRARAPRVERTIH